MWVFLFEPSSLFCLSSCAAPAVVGGQLQDSQSRLEIFCRRLHLHSPGYYLAGHNWIKLRKRHYPTSCSDSSEYICRPRPLLSHFWPPFVPVHKSICNLNMAGKSIRKNRCEMWDSDRGQYVARIVSNTFLFWRVVRDGNRVLNIFVTL